MPNFDEALEAALTQAESGATEALSPTPAPQEAPSPEEPALETQQSREEPEQPEDVAPTQEAPSTTTPPPPAQQAQGTPTPSQGQQSGGLAPRSWSPAVREHWGVLPREVKDQILKREGEVTRLVNESNQARKVAESLERTIQPYRAFIPGDPLQAVENVFRTLTQLQTAPAQNKAAIVANIIKSYGVDVNALADALDGQPVQQAQPHGGEYRDPRVDQLLQQMEAQQQRTTKTLTTRAQQELEAFANNAEFLDDVREDMVVLLETGRATTYQDAYRKACAMNEEVGKVLSQRKAEEAQRTQSQQVQHARHAAGSVRTEPAPPAGSRKPSMDDALWAALSGG